MWEPQPPEILRACTGLYRDCFNLIVEDVMWRGNGFKVETAVLIILYF
jgi:hypothetical protein